MICCGRKELRTSSLEYSLICSKSYRSLFVTSALDAMSIPLRTDLDLFILSSRHRSCHLTLKIQNTNAASLKIPMHAYTSSPPSHIFIARECLELRSGLSFQLSITSKKVIAFLRSQRLPRMKKSITASWGATQALKFRKEKNIRSTLTVVSDWTLPSANTYGFT